MVHPPRLTPRTFKRALQLVALVLTVGHVFCASPRVPITRWERTETRGPVEIDATGVAGWTPNHGLDAAQRQASTGCPRLDRPIWFENKSWGSSRQSALQFSHHVRGDARLR